MDDCFLLAEKTDEMVDPGGYHFDYNAFCQAYVENGKNPLTQPPLDWSSVVRLVEKEWMHGHPRTAKSPTSSDTPSPQNDPSYR